MIANTSGHQGISIAHNNSNVEISSNTFSNALGGVSIKTNNNNSGFKVQGNTFENATFGLTFSDGNVGTVNGNTFNGLGTAVSIFLTSGNVLTGAGNVISIGGTACGAAGVNPGSSITFTNGATCP